MQSNDINNKHIRHIIRTILDQTDNIIHFSQKEKDIIIDECLLSATFDVSSIIKKETIKTKTFNIDISDTLYLDLSNNNGNIHLSDIHREHISNHNMREIISSYVLLYIDTLCEGVYPDLHKYDYVIIKDYYDTTLCYVKLRDEQSGQSLCFYIHKIRLNLEALVANEVVIFLHAKKNQHIAKQNNNNTYYGCLFFGLIAISILGAAIPLISNI